MNNYYEILEVSKNASKEIIEKAYKVLAKKYHPDLQEESNKYIAEERMKLINEAYEILSDENKRREYNIYLENEETEEKLSKQEKNDYNEEEYYDNEQPLTKKQIKEQIKQEKRIQKQYKEQQERQYRKYMQSLGYRVKEKWTLKRILNLLKIISVIIITLLIIWFLPPTHKVLVNLYEQNTIIKIILDMFISILKGIGNGIYSVFKGIINK